MCVCTQQMSYCCLAAIIKTKKWFITKENKNSDIVKQLGKCSPHSSKATVKTKWKFFNVLHVGTNKKSNIPESQCTMCTQIAAQYAIITYIHDCLFFCFCDYKIWWVFYLPHERIIAYL